MTKFYQKNHKNQRQISKILIKDGKNHLFEQDKLEWHLLLHSFCSLLQLHRFPSHPDLHVQYLKPWPPCCDEALEILRRLTWEGGTFSTKDVIRSYHSKRGADKFCNFNGLSTSTDNKKIIIFSRYRLNYLIPTSRKVKEWR